MPGLDGTGPNGNGPMTGGGRGYCVQPVDANGTGTLGLLSRLCRFWPGRGQNTRPFGGRGRGRGMGRGRGRW